MENIMARKGQSLDEVFDSLGFDRTSEISRSTTEDFDQFEDFKEAMIAVRNAQKLTQKQVATHMKTTQSAVSEIELMTSNPTVSTLQRYVRALGYRLVVTAEKVNPEQESVSVAKPS
jgi:ribosome-binding protein aMBF1 (putative translation factor)